MTAGHLADAAEEVRVDSASIEKSLAGLWRRENGPDDQAVMRAALWNVVAHTWNAAQHSEASQILAKASQSIPQRTIVIRAEPGAKSEMSSWISANCHLVSGQKQVCSEEVAIVAGGDHVERIPPLVNALLIPDMPVAVWWVGDLPNENHAYVESLLDPADRLIVDSSSFDSAPDLALVHRIGAKTTTAPADLNWVRLEEWRVATAGIFDPPSMRPRLRDIRNVRVVACSSGNKFGDSVESLLYAAWLSSQAGHHVSEDGRVESGAGNVAYELQTEGRAADTGSLTRVEIEFSDRSVATIVSDDERRVLVATVDGNIMTFDCVTRVLGRGVDDLIVRQLKRPEADRVFMRVIPVALRLAPRILG